MGDIVHYMVHVEVVGKFVSSRPSNYSVDIVYEGNWHIVNFPSIHATGRLIPSNHNNFTGRKKFHIHNNVIKYIFSSFLFTPPDGLLKVSCFFSSHSRSVEYFRCRVSKSHRLTVVRPLKFFLTLRKILRFACAK